MWEDIPGKSKNYLQSLQIQALHMGRSIGRCRTEMASWSWSLARKFHRASFDIYCVAACWWCSSGIPAELAKCRCPIWAANTLGSIVVCMPGWIPGITWKKCSQNCVTFACREQASTALARKGCISMKGMQNMAKASCWTQEAMQEPAVLINNNNNSHKNNSEQSSSSFILKRRFFPHLVRVGRFPEDRQRNFWQHFTRSNSITENSPSANNYPHMGSEESHLWRDALPHTN